MEILSPAPAEADPLATMLAIIIAAAILATRRRHLTAIAELVAIVLRHLRKGK